MVRVVRTPSIGRKVYSANQLSGWPDGILYQPRRRKRTPKPKPVRKAQPARELVPIEPIELTGEKLF